MGRFRSSLAVVSAMVMLAGCDTGNPDLDYRIGKTEEVVGKTAQGAGSAMANAPETRTKVVGGGLYVAGVALEEDGKARVDRAIAAKAELREAQQ